MIALFCAAFKKKIIQEVGYLDESFGIGMFEDDDFSLRIKKHGYEIACAEDVFIHHHGRASFSKIALEEYQKLFDKNKEIYEKKWNISWIPHKYRSVSQVSCNNNKNKDILFFSIINWSFRYQRPQHIASYFAEEGYRVFYFDTTFMPSCNITRQKENLEVISLNNELNNLLYFTDLNINLNSITKSLDEIVRVYDIKDCIMISEYPNWHPITEYLKKKYNFKLVIDYLDEFIGFSTVNPITLKYNDIFMKHSDMILASSNYLYNRAKENGYDPFIIRNGTEFSHFYKAYTHKQISNKKRPIIGYYGAIAEWFDKNKIAYIASKKPEWDIVLIGDISTANLENLCTFPNINFLGEKSYLELPNYLKDFDVCIIPFLNIDLIKATNPVKFYEYLSAGKKIVATEIPELKAYKDVFVYLTNDDEKFLEYIELCLHGKDTLASEKERLTFAASQDWSVRCKEIETKLLQMH